MSTLCTKKEAEGRHFLLQTGCGSAGIHPSKKNTGSHRFLKNVGRIVKVLKIQRLRGVSEKK